MARVPAVAATLRRTRSLPVIMAVVAAVPMDRVVAISRAVPERREAADRPGPQAAEGRLEAEAGMMGDLHPAIVTAGDAATGAATLIVQMIRPARDPGVIGNDALVKARALGS